MPSTEQEVISPSSRILDAPTALFLFATLIFLYLFLFVPPFIPLNEHQDADYKFFLVDGMRMYQGEVMYRDFFSFYVPGTSLVNFFLLKLLGYRLWIPNLLSLLLGLGLVWLGVVVTKKLTRPSLALLPSAIFIVEVYGRLSDPTHHWYSLLVATAALAVLMERRTLARIAAAGFFCGLCVCFTQTRGLVVAAGFGVYLWWESWRRQEGWRKLVRKETWLVASFLATVIAVNGYFIWKVGLANFLWCTVVFVLKYAPKQADWNSFQVFRNHVPAFAPLRSVLSQGIGQWLFMYAVIPFIPILFFVRYGRESGKKIMKRWAD